MSRRKSYLRAKFRLDVFRRDGYRCVACGRPGYDRQGRVVEGLVALDAHHVTPREEMPNGGYVAANGVTLCDAGCHAAAEACLKTGEGDGAYSPAALYAKIGSDRGAAEATAQRVWL